MAIIVGIVALIIGIIIGFLICQFGFNKKPADSKTEQELEQTKHAFQEYQSQVGAHITKTVDLLEQMHTNYQQVQEHLFHGAQHLNLDNQQTTHYMPHQAAAIEAEKAKRKTTPKKTTTTINAKKVKQPKDYANGK